jgi:pimeloyl-ACP methyl ester carboxylesterase
MNNLVNNSATDMRYAAPPAVLDNISKDEMTIINKAMGEFFTPVRTEYAGFDQELMIDAHEHILESGIHATIWEAEGEHRWFESLLPDSVLLVHGWGGNSAQLSKFVRPLLAAGKRVVAIDMWAHGFSPGVESNCVKFAEGIAQAQAELGPFQHAVGHSLGAAAILVANYAGVKFDSAVLISPPSILLVMQKFLAHKGAPAKLLEPFVQMSERYVGKLRFQADTLLISKYISMPFLLIHDDQDRRCPISVSEKLASDNKNRRLIKTHGYGHHHIIGAQEVIEHTVDYLTYAGVATH